MTNIKLSVELHTARYNTSEDCHDKAIITASWPTSSPNITQSVQVEITREELRKLVEFSKDYSE